MITNSSEDILVKCPKCHKPYFVNPTLGYMECDVDGKIAVVVTPDHEQVVALQNQLQDITALIKTDPGISDDDLSRLQEQIGQLISRFENNQRIAPEVKYIFPQPEIFWADRRLVDRVTETQFEFGIALSFLSLFLGLAVQEFLDDKPVGLVTLATLVFIAITIYFFFKGKARRNEMEEYTVKENRTLAKL